MRRSPRRVVTAALVAALVSGCGQAPLTDEASAALEALVVATWDAAEAGDADAARDRLDDLRVRARELHEEGEVDEQRLEEVLAAADAVDERLGVLEDTEPVPAETADDAPEEADDEEDRERDEDERKEAGKAQEAGEKKAEKAREKERREAEKREDDD